MEWDEIQPGESAVLTVKYKAEEPGDFWRTITIYGNIRTNPLLWIFGELSESER